MRFRFREAKGFTLVEVLVVVVIIAILAAIAVSVYSRYVDSARAAEAQEAIASILAAEKVYYSTYGSYTTNVDNLKVDMNRSTLDRWRFQINSSPNELRTIIATSTEKMRGGAGKKVVFDAQTGDWTPDSYGQ
jgi:prepilin-type N-terminal cleavage/methylation domain-containing protein